MTSIGALRRSGSAVLAAGWLGACASPPQIAAEATAPPLVLEAFFAGTTTGEGYFLNSWSGTRREFRVTIAGSLAGDELILVEDFDYADGEKDRKTWHLRRTAPGVYSGTREDVEGLAQAWTENGQVRLRYSVKLGGWLLDFADVLALRPDGTLLNRAMVGKWGVRVGRVELVLRKPAA
jgi:hypothetical protein